ncbi:MAG: hypothetical protein WB930_01730 [Syntrophobacteraceae bacterium]
MGTASRVGGLSRLAIEPAEASAATRRISTLREARRSRFPSPRAEKDFFEVKESGRKLTKPRVEILVGGPPPGLALLGSPCSKGAAANQPETMIEGGEAYLSISSR